MDRSNTGGTGGSEAGAHRGTAGYASYRDLWTSVRAQFPTLVGRLVGSGGRGRTVAGAPDPDSEEEIPEWARGGGGVDEEVGGGGAVGETGVGNGSSGNGINGNVGGNFIDGDGNNDNTTGINGNATNANVDNGNGTTPSGNYANGNTATNGNTAGREEGNASGFSRNTGRSWTAALGLRKSAILANNASDQRAGGWGQAGDGALRDGGGFGSAGGGGSHRGLPRMGGCGKRTVPRALPAGRRQLFETLPGESYFRLRQDNGSSGSGNGGGSAEARRGGARGRRGGGGAGGAGWPVIEESASSGRCSLAIVVRPAVGAETGDWAGWRHRPTHRVTRQVRQEQGDTVGGGGGVLVIVHDCGVETVDPHIPAMPGWSNLCCHRPSRHCLRQAQRALKCPSSRMKREGGVLGMLRAACVFSCVPTLFNPAPGTPVSGTQQLFLDFYCNTCWSRNRVIKKTPMSLLWLFAGFACTAKRERPRPWRRGGGVVVVVVAAAAAAAAGAIRAVLEAPRCHLERWPRGAGVRLLVRGGGCRMLSGLVCEILEAVARSSVQQDACNWHQLEYLVVGSRRSC